MPDGLPSRILDLRIDQSAEIFKALAQESRLEILRLLSQGEKNINELGQALGLSQPTITKHIQQLEQAGLVESVYSSGLQGMQKRSRLTFSRLILSMDPVHEEMERVEEIRMPIGLYTMAHPTATCGLANREKIIGFLDKPLSFFDPDRASAQILWMSDGFVEYTLPNDLPTSMDIHRLELIMEVCSEAPNFNDDWPSDLTVWINGVEVGTWTCPADLGGRRGLLNPDWWVDHMTQFGFLKIWSIDRDGASVDGLRISDTTIGQLLMQPQTPISVRIGIKPDAEHRGGFNLFGSGFGNYPQDLVLRLHYAPKTAGNGRRGADAGVLRGPSES